MVTPDPLDDVAFLARSAHRVQVLESLAEGPTTRRDLHEETGISQPTLGRVLGPFEERNWVERRGHEYALTAWGELLAADFANLVDTVESIQRLGDVVQQLPTEEMDFDLRRFRDATVTLPSGGDAFRHVRRAEELLYSAEQVRNLTPTVAPGRPEDYQNQYERFMESEREIEAIVSVGALQTVAEQGMADNFSEAMDLDRVDLYLYDGDIPFMLGVADGTVVLAPVDEQGMITATIETDDEAITAWAHAQLDAYREQSMQVTPDTLPQ